MYHKFVGKAVRSVSGESETEIRTIWRKNKRKDVSWRKYKLLVLILKEGYVYCPKSEYRFHLKNRRATN
jgi:hypothetical protein